MQLKSFREQVLETALQMIRDGLAFGAGGNISARDPESGLIAITPSAIEYTRMSPEDVVVIDKDGVKIEGQWKPTSETPMHTIFYRERSDVGAVVHTHAPYASVFAISGEPIPMVVTESALCIGGTVKVAPYVRPGTEELAQMVLETMGSGVSVLLAQHGMIAVGPDLHSAYATTIATEVSARLTLLARSAGMKPITIDSSEVIELRQLYLEHYHPTKA
ncbi:MAG: class II aldolase/adducin family protein [Anaerolineales bacterium]